MEELLKWNGPMNFIFNSAFFLVALATCQDVDVFLSMFDRVENPTAENLHYLTTELVRQGNLMCLRALLLRDNSISFLHLFAEAIAYDQPYILKFLFSLVPTQESSPYIMYNGKREFLSSVAPNIVYHAFDKLNYHIFEILLEEQFLTSEDLRKTNLEMFARYNRCDLLSLLFNHNSHFRITLITKSLWILRKAFELKSYSFLMMFIDHGSFTSPYEVAEYAVDIQDVYFLRKLYSKYDIGDNFYFADYASRANLYLVVEFFVLERGYPLEKLTGNAKKYMEIILRTRTRAANKIFFMVGQYLYSGCNEKSRLFVERMASRSYDSLFVY